MVEIIIEKCFPSLRIQWLRNFKKLKTRWGQLMRQMEDRPHPARLPCNLQPSFNHTTHSLRPRPLGRHRLSPILGIPIVLQWHQRSSTDCLPKAISRQSHELPPQQLQLQRTRVPARRSESRRSRLCRSCSKEISSHHITCEWSPSVSVATLWPSLYQGL